MLGYYLSFFFFPFVCIWDFSSLAFVPFLRESFCSLVEFDTSRDEDFGDVNDNHVGIDVDSLVPFKVRKVSSINLLLYSGEKLQTWIDYEASSKRLEVRNYRPIDPLISYAVELSRVWGVCWVEFIKWEFIAKMPCAVPYWMHSEPLDPGTFIEKKKELNVHEKSDCALRILAALIFCTGCGALGAFVVLFMWTIMGNKHPVVPEDYAVQPVEFQYKNAKIVDKSIEEGKN
jgi:hypothetical protein